MASEVQKVAHAYSAALVRERKARTEYERAREAYNEARTDRKALAAELLVEAEAT